MHTFLRGLKGIYYCKNGLESVADASIMFCIKSDCPTDLTVSPKFEKMHEKIQAIRSQIFEQEKAGQRVIFSTTVQVLKAIVWRLENFTNQNDRALQVGMDLLPISQVSEIAQRFEYMGAKEVQISCLNATPDNPIWFRNAGKQIEAYVAPIIRNRDFSIATIDIKQSEQIILQHFTTAK